MGTDANVVVGSGLIYTAAVGTALPTITGTLASSITWTNWTNPGYSVGDVVITPTNELIDFTPAAGKTPIFHRETRKGATVKFILAETDADALNLVLPTSTISSAVVSDGGNTAEVYKAVAVETDLMVWHFKKVAFTLDGDVVLSDTDFNQYPVLLKCFEYTADSAGTRIYQVRERT